VERHQNGYTDPDRHQNDAGPQNCTEQCVKKEIILILKHKIIRKFQVAFRARYGTLVTHRVKIFAISE
jgi:hypothetical protein